MGVMYTPLGGCSFWARTLPPSSPRSRAADDEAPISMARGTCGGPEKWELPTMNDKRENDEHGILGYKDTIFGQNEGVFGCASQFIIGNKPYGIYLGYSAIRL